MVYDFLAPQQQAAGIIMAFVDASRHVQLYAAIAQVPDTQPSGANITLTWEFAYTSKMMRCRMECLKTGTSEESTSQPKNLLTKDQYAPSAASISSKRKNHLHTWPSIVNQEGELSPAQPSLL
jgi:hypothetical protein